MDLLFLEHPVLLIVIAFISYPVYFRLAKAFFGQQLETLGETLHYLYQNDWISIKKGEYVEDRFATMKFGVFACCCLLWPAAVTELLLSIVI